MSRLLIEGGMLLDGTGSPAERADVDIVDGLVVGVGLDAGRGVGADVERVDAAGRVVSPGFIDAHSHTDFTLHSRPAAEVLLAQGITTVVTGNCGFSPFPVRADGDHGYGAFFNSADDTRWTSFGAFAEQLDAQGLGVNVAPLVGHGSLVKHAGAAGVAGVVAALEEALVDGAFGASLGLFYVPGRVVPAEDLTTVAQVVARYDRVLAVHMRDERNDLDASLTEVIGLAESTGCALQVSHLKALGAINRGRTAQALARLDQARHAGLRVLVDAYPYEAGSTVLSGALPDWALTDGLDSILAIRADANLRAQLADTITSARGPYRLDEIVLSVLPPRWDQLAGTPLLAAAAERSQDPVDLLLELVIDSQDTATMLVTAMDAADVSRVIADPAVVVGSDGWLLEQHAGAHPRNYATFPTFFARVGRGAALPGAVHRCTQLTAQHFGLDRGVVHAGAPADLTLFAVNEDGTQVHVDTTIVAGAIAWTGNTLGPARGRVLRAGQ